MCNTYDFIDHLCGEWLKITKVNKPKLLEENSWSY
jgi:hypothetical protein